jgi:hypothetical protein
MAEETAEPQGVSFHDYNRTIVGYHGTTADVAERLVDGDPFTASDNDDDWFGKGIYFWEYAPKQAGKRKSAQEARLRPVQSFLRSVDDAD